MPATAKTIGNRNTGAQSRSGSGTETVLFIEPRPNWSMSSTGFGSTHWTTMLAPRPRRSPSSGSLRAFVARLEPRSICSVQPPGSAGASGTPDLTRVCNTPKHRFIPPPTVPPLSERAAVDPRRVYLGSPISTERGARKHRARRRGSVLQPLPRPERAHVRPSKAERKCGRAGWPRVR